MDPELALASLRKLWPESKEDLVMCLHSRGFRAYSVELQLFGE